MTAVASPPSLQPLPRWNSGDEKEGLDSMSAEEVTRMFMPRKSAQRTNSSSSMASMSSTASASNVSAPATPSSTPQTNGEPPTTNGDQGGWGPRKKPARLWPSSKAEPVSGVTTARPQALPTPSSGQSAASTMNSMHQSAPILPSQGRPPLQSQNGSRSDQSLDSPAILALLPMTGTFERKQIVVPFSPEVLRIGRQTNAKTVPTAVNGFFDSKVLSRQHAEVWAERNGKIWIRDVKSSNGTFVNGNRLSPENRDSEPHELHEQDTLELGIDIVSEDQKSIVHHKVSAKVELAGIYPNPPSLLEMELSNSHGAGNGALGDSMSQQLSQMRGRNGSQGSIGSNGRLSGPSNMTNNLNMMGPQRQVNMWMGPITVEQVMKKLTTELRSAKQQSQDLDRTEKFIDTLANLRPGEEPPKSPPKQPTNDQHPNHIHPPAQLDPLSPFSLPPAPPPQQPLPEKPDVAHIAPPESPSQPPLKRTMTEKPRSSMGSPNRAESGQIMSLVEALKIKTNELDSKVDYIKSLEVDLARERKAREDAERRALKISAGSQSKTHPYSDTDDETFEPPLDSLELIEKDLPNGHLENSQEESLSRSSSMSTIRNTEDAATSEEASSLATRLQAQLDIRNKEMNDMKMLMESYRQRAEEAEKGRKSLEEMVQNIRAGREPHSAAPVTEDGSTTLTGASEGITTAQSESTGLRELEPGSSSSLQSRPQPNGSATIDNMHRELEKTVSNVLQQQQRDWRGDGNGRMVQSAPYVSMVGVVLIGVGIMTWLNGWQPGGDK